MYCTQCGEFLLDGDVYCSKCGRRVKPVVTNIVPVEKRKNVCSILAIIFGSIGFVPGLNFLFLPPAIVLAIVGLATGRNKRKGATIACAIVVSLSLLCSIGWMSGLSDEDEDADHDHNHNRDNAYHDRYSPFD